MSAERLGWLVPSDPSAPWEELRARYARDGYLWLRGLLDPQAVRRFRGRFFAAMQGTGLLAEGSDAADGIGNGGDYDRRLVGQQLVETVRWAAYEAFCLSQPVIDFYDAFFGAPAYLHKRKLLRMGLPGDPHCTGAHYDLVYLRAGTDQLCTSWIPIGDASVEMGGLLYLEGSDAFGRELEARYARESAHLSPEERIQAVHATMTGGWLTRDLRSLADRMKARWLVADYAAGDMVVHSPFMIHASTQNIDPSRRIRLSTDIRFQSVRDRIDPRWQRDWSPDDGL